MSSKEKLKSARTIREVLFILSMHEYLPLFEKANIFQASALRLLKEADLKYIGIDNSGRQKLLKAARHIPNNIPMTVGDKIRQQLLCTEIMESKRQKNNETFCLQKAQDELMRCKAELNLKRNELARLQKQNKLIHEIFEMTKDAKDHVQELRKNCYEYGSLSMQRLAFNLESLLNNIYLPNVNSNPTNENIPPSTIAQNRNLGSPKIQQHLPQLPLKQWKKQNNRHNYSEQTGTRRWYTKILKPTTNQHYKQPPVVIYYPINEDKRQNKTTAQSMRTKSQYEQPNFIDELFTQFGENKTSTPCKQQSLTVKRYPNNNNNTGNRSFVHHSRQKVKNVFMKASKR